MVTLYGPHPHIWKQLKYGIVLSVRQLPLVCIVTSDDPYEQMLLGMLVTYTDPYEQAGLGMIDLYVK